RVKGAERLIGSVSREQTAILWDLRRSNRVQSLRERAHERSGQPAPTTKREGGMVFHRTVAESTLENGLTVLTVENRTSPTATLQVWYRVGSRNERTGITGISHIFEHMM